MSRLIIFVIYGFLFYFLYRFLRSLFFPPPTRPRRVAHQKEQKVINDMVQDPQCGIYVTPGDAYRAQVGNQIVYFCSEECFKKYLQKK